ncbi:MULTISPECIES: hypothetical protein [Acetobacter]|uniref:Lipoprotein SmpA/OmlA domain-containing protein n=1 Tax=Acetobacter cerevisiae TaxID=178900 RepID=A0A149V907_9PROT|nr:MULTISPECIES: hypothetical protein [Acetobacter]KXV76750.1 hypothetical protein AD954_10485 [Acetobacter cerevisiae]
MTHRKLLLLVSMLSLAACQVPTAKERRQLDSMIGKQAVDVVRTYGVPTREFVSGNHTFLSYINQQTDYSMMPMSGWGGTGTAYTYTCQTNFELVNGVVSAWTMRGDGC